MLRVQHAPTRAYRDTSRNPNKNAKKVRIGKGSESEIPTCSRVDGVSFWNKNRAQSAVHLLHITADCARRKNKKFFFKFFSKFPPIRHS